ncbi:hypothetical protein MLD38_011414 [Melastoma candidum]|uniref:Uncharacterized protein n=1 Tax=Melastoma candidum TaxID=119954 RepID=A0ACB9R303_9MYRT|nr:hypothetical protein MLD38_011414 [Melastoma candidum]
MHSSIFIFSLVSRGMLCAMRMLVSFNIVCLTGKSSQVVLIAAATKLLVCIASNFACTVKYACYPEPCSASPWKLSKEVCFNLSRSWVNFGPTEEIPFWPSIKSIILLRINYAFSGSKACGFTSLVQTLLSRLTV